jgi:hypothetical protein
LKGLFQLDASKLLAAYGEKVLNLFIHGMLGESRLWRKFKANPENAKIEATYRNAENRCRLLVRNFELKLESEVIHNEDTGSFYKFVNKRLSCKQGIGTLKNSNGEYIAGDTDRANLLNRFFCSVYEFCR